MFVACAKSVLRQSNSSWEWILVDDASGDHYISEELERLRHADARVDVLVRETNGGIVAATNDGIARATGEFVVLLDHDDTLAESALNRLSEVIDAVADVDYIYSDECIVSQSGEVVFVQRKPAWSPERLRSHNYCCHLSAFRRSVLASVGGMSPGLDGAQDYDLILRVTEHARRVVHIPEVLYEWRQAPESTAGNPDAKPWAYEAGRRAVALHCERIGIDADVLPTAYLGVQHVKRRWSEEPLVSIVVPTGGRSALTWGENRPAVIACVKSIVEGTQWENFEIVLVEDSDTPVRVIEEVIDSGRDYLVRVPFDEPFNFSRKCNLGALRASGEYLIFLNDDTEVISDCWIHELVGPLREPDVGLTGAKLLFPDGTVQHAGQCWNGYPGHVHYRMDDRLPGTMNALHVARECAGVTAACAGIRRSVFDEVGGFTQLLGSNYNDVDLSLKVGSLGYRIVWTPYARLWHFESTSRDPDVADEETAFILRRWKSILSSDRYFTPEAEDTAAQAHFGASYMPPSFR